MSEIVIQEIKRIYERERTTLAECVVNLQKEIAINIDVRKNETYKVIEDIYNQK
jgi:hypothetical protein